MLFTLVWVLAAITAWCVATLAVVLLVGPLLRRPRRATLAGERRPVSQQLSRAA